MNMTKTVPMNQTLQGTVRIIIRRIVRKIVRRTLQIQTVRIAGILQTVETVRRMQAGMQAGMPVIPTTMQSSLRKNMQVVTFWEAA